MADNTRDLPEPRTSTTHPLEIDDLPCGTGVVGMTLCPGKCATSHFGRPWERDLTTDTRAVVDWGATTLVTLMEGPELERLGVGNLGAVAEAAGLEWHHLLITDVQVPDAVRTPVDVFRARSAKEARVGQAHRAALPRWPWPDGTIAARLAIELGADPAEALRAVRRARLGTVETREQEGYVLACRPNLSDDAYAERVLGCLLGGAVGDALGCGVEFLDRWQIEERYGTAGIREPELNEAGEAEVSDDTQMTFHGGRAP